VKVAFTPERLMEGLLYLGDAVPYLGVLMIPAVAAIVVGLVGRGRSRRTSMLGVQLIAWLAYVAIIGGDIFPARRHWVPALVIAAMLVADLTQWLSRQGGTARLAAWVGTGMMLVLLVATQQIDPEAERAVQERWEWDGQDVGELLRQAFGAADPLIACDPAGCIPYFTKFRAIDMMGLNDYHIARQRPPEFGRRALGHELGDGKYVLDREPDLVLWSIPTGSNWPVSPSAVQMAQDPRFARNYRLVFLATIAPGRKAPVYCGLWLRVHSDRIGMRWEDGRLILPGVLAASGLDRPATIDPQGRLGVLARVETPGQMKGILLPPGRWRVTAESDVPVRIRLRASDKVVEGVGELLLDAGRDAPGLTVDLELTPASTPAAHVRRVVLSP
jgi:arabinofuranosyltransferase